MEIRSLYAHPDPIRNIPHAVARVFPFVLIRLPDGRFGCQKRQAAKLFKN
jgi:hypothetical protein